VMAFVRTGYLSVIDTYLEFAHFHHNKKVSVIAWNPFITKPLPSSKRWEEDDKLLCEQSSDGDLLENMESRKTCTTPIDQ
jgi:hypothetical protein